METQELEHQSDIRLREIRRQMVDPGFKIRSLERRLNQVSTQRDSLRGNNDHLFRELSLARPEIEELQSRVRDLERDLAEATSLSSASDASLRRLRDVLRLTQEEIVTREYVGSLHGGSAHGELSPPDQAIDQPDHAADQPDPSGPGRDQAVAEVSRLTKELAVAHTLVSSLTAERNSAQYDRAAVTTERGQLQTQLTTANPKITKMEHERDNACTSWANEARAQTELEARIFVLSTYAQPTIDRLTLELTRVVLTGDQLKTAQQSATTLQTRVSKTLRRLALVTATVSEPTQVPGAPDLPASAHNATPSSVHAGSSSLRAGSTYPVSIPAHPSGVPTQSSAQTDPSSTQGAGGTAPATGATRSSGSVSRRLDLTASGRDQAPSKRARSRSPSEESGPTRPRKQSCPVYPDRDGHDGADADVDLAAPAEIDDDGGQEENADPASAVPDLTPAGAAHMAPPSNQAKPTPLGYGFSSPSDSEADEEPEDDVEPKIADELLEEDTLRALSQSRSEARRLSHASHKSRLSSGSGPSPDSPSGSHDGSSGAGGSGGSGPPDPGSRPSAPPQIATSAHLLPQAPFGPDDACIPGRSRPRPLVASEPEPWAVSKLNRVPIASMKIVLIFPDLPFLRGWIFPQYGGDVPATEFCVDRISQDHIERMTAAKPWAALDGPGTTFIFRAEVGGRLGIFVSACRSFEVKHHMTLWEGGSLVPDLASASL
ncbi:hypothetical protein PI124_g21011 [Phytophthora idaei]|nr:hypothetical protein PI125_g23804 [Phytophthora idaei]KAG3129806.1 hypothetical protein PI126_g20787 [Phytophthora idaei]KAG3233926.1 hypothetical protein PI124_g21011 [Phytophthora idaei]